MRCCFWLFKFFAFTASAQTDLAISEFRYQKNILDLRLRPAQYSIKSSTIRNELFAGIRLNKQTTLFSYNQYTAHSNSFKTGFRIDYRQNFNSFSVSNQIRYLRTITGIQQDFLAYILDFNFLRNQNLTAGLRSFLILNTDSRPFKKRNLYTGPSILISKGQFSFFINYLPDLTEDSYDHLFILMAIIKVNA